jgi:hypothetical protein
MAHTYSTDSAERQYIPFFVAALAIGAAFLLFGLLKKYHIDPPWWASPPIDTMTLYGLFYFIFDRFIWRWRLVHRLRITRIPNLTGKWRGTVNPAPTNGVSAGLIAPIDIQLTVWQTWTRLIINGETELSTSHSLSGHIVVVDDCSISYQYMNEPRASAPATMQTHRGTARLTVTENVLDGEYYSGRGRQNIGTIRLTKPS